MFVDKMYENKKGLHNHHVSFVWCHYGLTKEPNEVIYVFGCLDKCFLFGRQFLYYHKYLIIGRSRITHFILTVGLVGMDAPSPDHGMQLVIDESSISWISPVVFRLN